MKSWDKYELDDVAKIFLEEGLIENLNDLDSSFNQLYKELEHKINTVSTIVKLADEKGEEWNNIKYIWNLAGFILMTSLDLKICCESLIKYHGFGKQELQYKNLCVIIYETSEDIEQIMGRQFFEICDKINISEVAINNLKTSKKSLSRFKKEHQKSLKEIRTLIGAHRDHDFLEQLKSYESFSSTAFIKVVLQFDEILNRIASNLQLIMKESTATFTADHS